MKLKTLIKRTEDRIEELYIFLQGRVKYSYPTRNEISSIEVNLALLKIFDPLNPMVKDYTHKLITKEYLN